MSILQGCQEGKSTPKLVEIKCPQCGEVIEVFIRLGGLKNAAGVTVGDAKCEKCGYAVPEDTDVSKFESI